MRGKAGQGGSDRRDNKINGGSQREEVQVQERCTRAGVRTSQMREITHEGGHGRTNYTEKQLDSSELLFLNLLNLFLKPFSTFFEAETTEG